MTDLLLIDKDRERSDELSTLLSAHGINVQAAEAVDNLALGQFDCLLIDHDEIPSDFANITEQLPVIVLALKGTIKEAVNAIQLGAKDYLEQPIEHDEPVSYTHLTLPTNREV